MSNAKSNMIEKRRNRWLGREVRETTLAMLIRESLEAKPCDGEIAQVRCQHEEPCGHPGEAFSLECISESAYT